jgi:hypothetical protein
MYDMADVAAVADVVDIGDRSLWSFDRSDCTGLSAILFINLTWLLPDRVISKRDPGVVLSVDRA